MVYRIAMVLSVLSIAGCGLSETKFGKKFAELSCEKTNECTGASEDCAAAADDTNVEGEEEYECDFDKGKAKECLDAVEAAECNSEEGAILPWDLPAVCGEVATECMPK